MFYKTLKAGRLDAIPADIYVRCYASIKAIQRDNMPAVPHLQAPCGIWIHGLSGCGKTRSVVAQCPHLFIKPRNNWWDGYAGESTVLLDDVDKFDVALGGKLKHWADCYAFIGESKGTSVRIRPTMLVVTSQYRIEDIWNDTETNEALQRRFKVVEKILGQEIIINL